MSWRQFVRAVEADARRQRRRTERAAVQRYRELQRAERDAARFSAAHAKQAEKARAAHEAARFENYLELLVSVHKDSGDAWDWNALANAAAPPLPAPGFRNEQAAAAALQAYRPSFFEKLFGGDKKRTTELQAAVSYARSADATEHAEAMRQHQFVYTLWNTRRLLAPRILSRDASIYAQALEHADAFEELSAFKTRVTVAAAELDVVALWCEMTDSEIVPTEEVKCSAAGKLSTKEMPAGRYWPLYQDHVCSCAIRVASETFAILPISRAIVNVGAVRANTSTGHNDAMTFLAVHFVRSTLSKLNLENIDPSDSMKNFPHRMKFKKTSGFEPVPPITPDEQWVTT